MWVRQPSPPPPTPTLLVLVVVVYQFVTVLWGWLWWYSLVRARTGERWVVVLRSCAGSNTRWLRSATVLLLDLVLLVGLVTVPWEWLWWCSLVRARGRTVGGGLPTNTSCIHCRGGRNDCHRKVGGGGRLVTYCPVRPSRGPSPAIHRWWCDRPGQGGGDSGGSGIRCSPRGQVVCSPRGQVVSLVSARTKTSLW